MSEISMSPLSSSDTADPQSGRDNRGIALQQVGISRVRYPILISGWENDAKRQREVDGLFDLILIGEVGLRDDEHHGGAVAVKLL